MKRILIITYYWPPSGGSGVQRWLKFSKYLPEYGWQPVVYTPENPDFAIQDESMLKEIPTECEVIKRKIWEPYQLYRLFNKNSSKENVNFGMTKTGEKESLFSRFSKWVRGNLFVPDPRVFWVRPSVRFLKKYLREHPVDAIATTGPPHSMHLIGLGLKKAFPKLNWIADMRDPWATFDILNNFNLSDKAVKKHFKLEKSVLDTADWVVTVSPSMPDEFQPFDRRKSIQINNGFDNADFQNVDYSKPPVDGKFRIYHTGLLNFIRNPEGLWEVLADLFEHHPGFREKAEVELIGAVDDIIRKQIEQHPVLSKKIHIRGWMSHDTLLEEYAKAGMFLLLPNKSRNARAQITGKAYEYFVVGRPILCVGPRNMDVADILEETGLGITCEHEDKAGIRKAILHYFELFEKGEKPAMNTDSIQQYARKNLTKKLVETVLT